MDRAGHPKEKNGYVKIFNELLEALMSADIPKRARKLIDVQMRFSFGCGPQYFTYLTKQEFSTLAALDWSNTHRALGWLVQNNIFEADPDDPNRFKLNKFYHDWRIKVGLRDDPEYGKKLRVSLKKILKGMPGETPDEPVKTTDAFVPLSVETTDEPVKTTDDFGPPSVETTDARLSKRQMRPPSNSMPACISGPVKQYIKQYNINKDLLGMSENSENLELYKHERYHLHLLKSIPNYPFNLDKDLSFIRDILTDFPEVDIDEEIKNWKTWLLDKNLKGKTNYRSRLRRWLTNSIKYTEEKAHEKRGDNSGQSEAYGKKRGVVGHPGRKGFDLPSDYPIDAGDEYVGEDQDA